MTAVQLRDSAPVCQEVPVHTSRWQQSVLSIEEEEPDSFDELMESVCDEKL